jgi:protein-L-isoaspartate(D-aspartate) O-methyltransferase
MLDFRHERESMVRDQIEARGVRDRRVLAAMLKVERHRFVPFELWQAAYLDSPLPIGEYQTISQPFIVALMTELLALEGHEKVLEIGTGSGYQTAILGELAREVYSLEVLKPLAESADKRLAELGYHNIHVKNADGYNGWREQSPFDGIIATCAPADIPAALVEQLAEGGRLAIPVGTFDQELVLVRKVKGQAITTKITPVRFVPMVRIREAI